MLSFIFSNNAPQKTNKYDLELLWRGCRLATKCARYKCFLGVRAHVGIYGGVKYVALQMWRYNCGETIECLVCGLA